VYYYHSDIWVPPASSPAPPAPSQRIEYTPYGSVAVNEGTDAAKYKFTGKELDKSGLYFYGARYYNPELGRFITADTIVQAPYIPKSQ